ncbi:MAG TPA: DNA-directed RNA polymerase subunit D [archaeon]|nr:DNA-directed RNA polymerase subunit D [archaeon]
MKIQVLEKNESEIRFVLEEVTPAFAGSLRRLMMSEVPTMAIEWVDFRKNDSALYDELIANRLGQVPLTFDKKAYDLPEDCKCEAKGCSRCQVKLTLKKVGPGMVYAEDLKSKSKDVVPVFGKTPIVELFEGQDIEFEATAQLGRGKSHAKWQAAIVGYKNRSNITIDKNCNVCAKCVERCLKGALKIDGNKICVENPFECNLCNECVDVCPKSCIKVEPVENGFIFNVETVSGLPPEEIVSDAIDILESKLKEFDKGLKKLK